MDGLVTRTQGVRPKRITTSTLALRLGIKRFMDRLDYGCSFAHTRGNTFDRACTDIADCEDTRLGRGV